VSDRHAARVLLAVLGERWEAVASLLRGAALDAPAFLHLCAQADVSPTVHAILQRADRLALLGPGVAEGLAAARLKTQRDNLLLLARLEQALDIWLAAGIRPVVLKGVDVLHRLYRSFDERVLDDVDVLVPADRRHEAIALLERAGWAGPPAAERATWERSSFEMPLVAPGPVGVAFEIHWSLGQARRYAIDAASIVARARPIDVAGRSVLRLEDHDAVAHLLLHHVQHYFDRRLKWVLEIGMLSRAEGFSWSEVAGRLESWRGLGAAGLALAHVRKLFPDLLPPEAFATIPTDAWRLLATLPLRSGHPLDLYRGTRRRGVQLLIAAAALERPLDLPGYLRHRATRDRVAPAD